MDLDNQKGITLFKKAENELKKKVKLFGNKYQSAMELLERAAECFRTDVDFYMVGKCYVKCSEICNKTKSKSGKDSVKYMKDAAAAFQFHYETELQRALSQMDGLEADIILLKEGGQVSETDSSTEEDEKRTFEDGHKKDMEKLMSSDDRSVAHVPVHNSTNAENEMNEKMEELEREMQDIRGQLGMIRGFEEAVDCMQKVAIHMAGRGEILQAAKQERDLGMFKSENAIYRTDVDVEKHFRQAADYYEMVNKYENANLTLMELYAALSDQKKFEDAEQVIEVEIIDAEWNRDRSATGNKHLLRFEINKLLFHLMLFKIAKLNQQNFQGEEVRIFVCVTK